MNSYLQLLLVLLPTSGKEADKAASLRRKLLHNDFQVSAEQQIRSVLPQRRTSTHHNCKTVPLGCLGPSRRFLEAILRNAQNSAQHSPDLVWTWFFWGCMFGMLFILWDASQMLYVFGYFPGKKFGRFGFPKASQEGCFLLFIILAQFSVLLSSPSQIENRFVAAAGTLFSKVRSP